MRSLFKLYASPNIIRVIKYRNTRWAGHVARMADMRNVYKILVRKPEGRRLLRRPRCKWEDMRMIIREIGWENIDWIHLAQGRDQWRAAMIVVMNLRVTLRAGNFLTS
jgi:hypothetical protein